MKAEEPPHHKHRDDIEHFVGKRDPERPKEYLDGIRGRRDRKRTDHALPGEDGCLK